MEGWTELGKLTDMAYACRRCGYCREKYSDSTSTRMVAYRVCPIREHSGGFEHHYARGKMQIAQGIMEGQFSYSEELINLIYTDPDCKLCSWVCGAEPVLDPSKVWLAMRKDIVTAGLGPPAKLREIDSRVSERHNAFGGKPEVRSRWAQEIGLPDCAEILYFAGCHASYQQTEIARATVAILRAAGINIGYMGEDEWCCGVVQFHDGSMSVAEQMARHNVEAIEATGAQTVITSCAECYKSLRIEYPEIFGELSFEVIHISEAMASLQRTKNLTFHRELPERKVTFHDPCHLGRYCGVYDPPRDVIRGIPGVDLVEMLRHRDWAWCCGNGADMVRSMEPDLATRIASERIEEAREAGAEAIITACPRCSTSLNRGANSVKVYDLTVAVALAMGLDI